MSDLPQNADSGRGISVVAAQDKDEFWWICKYCGVESYRQTTPMAAYYLAVVHARYHAWPDYRDHIQWGWARVSPTTSSETP